MQSSPVQSTSVKWHQRLELLWQFTLRAIEMKHRGSYLGMFWAMLNPLLMLGLYTFVFGVIFGSKFRVLPNETGVDFAFSFFLGFMLFHVMAETLAVAPSVIITSPNLVKKVVFPLEILPLSQLGAFWFNFLISLALLLVGILVAQRELTWEGVLWLPIIILPHVIFTIGLSWLLAALGVFFRDIAQVIQFLSQVLMYASAIMYSLDIVSPRVWSILKWNPLLHTINLARNALLWHRPINVMQLGYTYCTALMIFIFGRWFFMKSRPAFADVI